MQKVNLNVVDTLKEGIGIGIKNLPSLIGAALLYLVTLWVPYINVGTSIAMQSIPGRLAKGEVISPLFIFDSVYRRDFSSYFLLMFFLTSSILFGLTYLIIPGIVILISLSLSMFILIDSDVTPLKAMKLSNQATYGHKLDIFVIFLLFAIAMFFLEIIVFSIAAVVGRYDAVGVMTLILLVCFVPPFVLGIISVIYRELYLERIEEFE